MTISKLSFDNLKGVSFSAALAPATLIVGPNFSGKTAILDAIRLVLQGYIPELGKTNAALYDLASGLEMSATLELSDGRELGRRLWKERGSVKMDGTNPEPTPLLDGETYFGLSDAKRIDYVFSRVPLPESFTVAGIIARLQRLTFGAEHSEAIETAKAEVIASCQKVFARESAPGRSVGDAVRAGLANLTEFTLKDDFTVWNRAAQDSIGTVRTLNELKNREGECSAETMTDLENKLSRLTGLLEEANREYGALQSQATAAESSTKRRAELLARIAAPEPSRTAPVKRAVVLEPVPSSETVSAALGEVLIRLRKMRQVDTSLGTAAEEAHAAGSAAALAHNQAMAKLRAAQEAVTAKEGELAALAKLEHCPWCECKGKGWRKNVESRLNEQLFKLREEQDAACLAEQSANSESARAADALNAAARAAEQEEAYNRDVEALEAERDKLTRQVEEIESATARIIDNNLRLEREAQRNYGWEQKDYDRDTQDWAARRQRDRDELAALQLTAPPTPEELEAAATKLATLGSEAATVRDQITVATRLQQDIRRAAEAAEKHQLAVARKEVIGAVGKALKAIKGEMVAAAFGELLKLANDLCGALLPSPLEYDADAGDIGRRGANGRFVTHRTFSGTEKALAYAAISAALTSKSALRLVLLDELARLTPDLQERVLETLQKAVADGRLDQVIAVLPIADGQKVEINFNGAEKCSVIRTGEGQ